MRRATIAVAACLLAACGLSVTGVEPESRNAGVDAGDSGSSPPKDGGPIADSAPIDSGPKRFCESLSPAPNFCEDFDTSPDASDGWDLLEGTGLKRTTTEFKSEPGSLDAISTGGSISLLDKDFSVTSSISVELDIRYKALPIDGELSPLVIRPSNGMGGYVYLYARTDRLYMQVSNNEYSKWLTPPTVGEWHHVALSVTFDSSKTTFAGTFDGKSFDWSETANTTHPWQIAQKVTVQIGVNPYQASGEMFIDNVVVRAK